LRYLLHNINNKKKFKIFFIKWPILLLLKDILSIKKHCNKKYLLFNCWISSQNTILAADPCGKMWINWAFLSLANLNIFK